MILFPGRHLMGVLECHQLTPPNNMVSGHETRSTGSPKSGNTRISVSGHETRSTGSPKSGKTWIYVSGHETQSTGSPKSGKSWISVSGHETRSTGTPKTGKSWIFMSGHETRFTRTRIPEKLGSPCQDMNPGPQGKLMYYYFYHGSNLREIIRFLCEIECIQFECNIFVLGLVLIDLIHFEHSICISST
jgi:hypothetical protein